MSWAPCREELPLTVLTTAFDGLAPLHQPIMVLALRGLFDTAEVATDAVATLSEGRVAAIVASIDPDPFFDFTQERPLVEFDDDDERQIRWPSNEFRVARFPGWAHDLVLLSGVEPHLRYSTFADAVVSVATTLGCEVVVTLGAAPEAVPHTRPPQVVGSSTTDGLVRALGLSRPRYQGVTGLVGVVQERLDQAGLPAVSLRVGVPHYLGNAKHPQASAALLRHLEHVLGVPTGHGALAEDAMRWRTLHDEAVAEDEQAARYVEMLESEYDRRVEAAMPTADDLAAEFERFLREQRDDPQ
ncbi:MAG: PAC2 family protein [Actinomycetota bacterium]